MTQWRWWGLYAVWCIALVGLALSVYFAEIAHFEPCRLCWYQRMALFPLVLLLGFGAYRSDLGIIPYALPFAILGALIAFYHILQESFPLLQTTALCGEKGDCSEPIFLLFDFFTFPMLSALGFVAISTSLLFMRHQSHR